jgi:hypothetical protein
VQHRFAQRAQALVLRQLDAELDGGGAAQLVQRQLAQAALARQQLGRDRSRAIHFYVHLQHQLAQQRAHLEHAALAPGCALRRGHAGAGRARILVDVERAQLGRLDDRHHMLDRRRDPHRAPARHEVGAVAGGDARHAAHRQRHLRPRVAVRLDLGVGVEVAHLGAHRPCGRGHEAPRVLRRHHRTRCGGLHGAVGFSIELVGLS